MNQSELITAVSDVTGVKKSDVETILKTTGDVVKQALVEGNEAALPGLGKLTVKVRAARTGRNPQTGETIEIPEKRVPGFSAAKSLKDAL